MSPTTNRRKAGENSMAAAEGQISPQAFQDKAFQDQAPRERSWHEIVLQTLKRNEIRLVPYVPDRVLTTLIQTSGFATLANVLASLAIPYQIPLIMFVSERGTLGEFNYGQSLVCRTMRPVLDSLAMEHHTCTRLEEFEFIVDRSIKQALTTQAPVALILSPLLTGGKTFDK